MGEKPFESVYSALDTTTLLALIPVLKSEGSRALEILKHAEKMFIKNPEQYAELSEVASETILKLEGAKTGSPDEDAALAEMQNTMRRLHQELRNDPEADRSFYLANAEYALEFSERERWIRGELERRGILPQFVPPASS